METFSPSNRYYSLVGATWLCTLLGPTLIVVGAYFIDPALTIVAAGILLIRTASAFSETAIAQLYREHDTFVEGYADAVAGLDAFEPENDYTF